MKQNAHYRRLRSACSRESIRDTSALELLPGVHLVEAQREKRREKKEKKPERERERQRDGLGARSPIFSFVVFCAAPQLTERLEEASSARGRTSNASEDLTRSSCDHNGNGNENVAKQEINQ